MPSGAEDRNPRRQQRRAVLRLTREAWRLHPLDGETDSGPIASGVWDRQASSGLAESVAEALGGPSPADIVLAIEAELCLAASFTVPSPSRRRKRDALLYQLEEQLPVAAEEVAADFSMHKLEVFGVCCDAGWLTDLVRALAERRVMVRHACPTALLATLAAPPAKEWPEKHQLAWERPETIELIGRVGATPVSWQSLPNRADSLAIATRASELVSCSAQAVYAPGAEAESRLRYTGSEHEPSLAQRDRDDPCLAAALAASRSLLRGEAILPIDLLRGLKDDSVAPASPLGPSVRALQASLLALLLAVAGYGYRVAAQADEAAGQAANGQAELFRHTFPEQRVPRGVRSRLKSELRRLEGVQGSGGAMPAATPALQVVRQTLRALPQSLRIRLLEIRVEQGRVFLEGQARRHGDADRIAAALRRQSFEVDPPSTQQLPDKGVDFRITAACREPGEDTEGRPGL